MTALKALACFVGVALTCAATVARPSGQEQAVAPPALDVLRIRPNFYLIAGAGANVGVQTGIDGTVVVVPGRQTGRRRSWRQSRRSARARSAT